MADIGTMGQMPGVYPSIQTTEANLVFGRDSDLLMGNVQWIGSAQTDAGNTPSTTLRAGMLLGIVTSTKKLAVWDALATDGSQIYWGVLGYDISMLDSNGVAEDKNTQIIRKAPFVAGALFIKGVALVGHADEAAARRQMIQNGCMFDDASSATYSGGSTMANNTVSGATHAPTAAQSGTRFNYTQAGTATVTLPAIQSGLVYEFLQTVAQTLVVQSTEGTNIIDLGALNASSITFSTGGKQIGAMVRFESIYEGASNTLKWLMTIPTTANGTGMTGGVAYALA